MNRRMVVIACLFMVLAIVLGAFGAHGLKKIVPPESVMSFETGVKYQFYSAFGLMILGLNSDKFQFSLKWVNFLLILGTILFSFSIYLLSIQTFLEVKLTFLGPITPIGGMLMIIAWLVLLVKLMKK